MVKLGIVYEYIGMVYEYWLFAIHSDYWLLMVTTCLLALVFWLLILYVNMVIYNIIGINGF
jgi:hypothetical protein